MLGPIRESDWKVFRELHSLALERYCERVLTEIREIIDDSDLTNHQRYQEIFARMERRDEEIARLFNNPRRSQALFQATMIVAADLLTEEELSRFSAETRKSIHPSDFESEP